MKPFGFVALVWAGSGGGDKVEALISYEESQMAALHIFCVPVCFLKQLQNFALGDIFFVPVCSATNLLLSEYFERNPRLEFFFFLTYVINL